MSAIRCNRFHPGGWVLVWVLWWMAPSTGGCNDEFDYAARGGPPDPVVPLGQLHPGYGSASCGLCHELDQVHEAHYTVDDCAVCHGGNGAPRLALNHPEYCEPCHGPPSPHGAAFSFDRCTHCHLHNDGGGRPENRQEATGTPAIDDSHPGWGNADCVGCHPTSWPHQSAYSFTVCGACHGPNGGPDRPENHYLERCNDCHQDGPAPWNDCTHSGYELAEPKGCLNCHP